MRFKGFDRPAGGYYKAETEQHVVSGSRSRHHAGINGEISRVR